MNALLDRPLPLRTTKSSETHCRKVGRNAQKQVTAAKICRTRTGFEIAAAMSATMSADHRAVDCALGARLPASIVENLENPLRMPLSRCGRERSRSRTASGKHGSAFPTRYLIRPTTDSWLPRADRSPLLRQFLPERPQPSCSKALRSGRPNRLPPSSTCPRICFPVPSPLLRA